MDVPLHPMLVHFPIALLFVSALFDLLSRALGRDSLRDAALWLLGLGILGGAASAVAGTMAEEAAEKAGVAESLIETHEALAFATLGVMIVLFLYRLWCRNQFSPTTFAVYAVGLVIGLGAISATGHTGGALVYEQGAGMAPSAAATARAIAEAAPAR